MKTAQDDIAALVWQLQRRQMIEVAHSARCFTAYQGARQVPALRSQHSEAVDRYRAFCARPTRIGALILRFLTGATVRDPDIRAFAFAWLAADVRALSGSMTDPNRLSPPDA